MRRLGEAPHQVLPALAAAIAVFASGCLDGGTASNGGVVADSDDPSSPYIPIAVSPDEAAIDGVVLSDAFQPIEGAIVELRGIGRAATTDNVGRFAFLGLEPGTYALTASLDGYNPASTTAALEAGRVATVQLFLAPLASDVPYFLRLEPLNGFISCGFGFNPVNPESCRAPFPGPAGEDANHRVHFTVPADANLTAVLFEMTWTPRGQFAGTNLLVRLNEPASAAFEVAGGSPIVKLVEAVNQTFTPEAQNLSFDVRVAPGTTPVQGGDWTDSGGLVVEQPFTVYLTLFYQGHAVPDGFTAQPEV